MSFAEVLPADSGARTCSDDPTRQRPLWADGVDAPDHTDTRCTIRRDDWDVMYRALLLRIRQAGVGQPSNPALRAQQLHALLTECLADLALLMRSSGG